MVEDATGLTAATEVHCWPECTNGITFFVDIVCYEYSNWAKECKLSQQWSSGGATSVFGENDDKHQVNKKKADSIRYIYIHNVKHSVYNYYRLEAKYKIKL